MQTFTAPIVGMYYRPPAKVILSFLQAGSDLTLQREPENPYDANAVMVLANVNQISESLHTALAEAAAPFGFELNELLEQGDWHLGYIGREFAVHLAKLLDDNPSYTCTLKFNFENKPLAEIEMEI
jgi:hypothetical protein